MERGSEADRGLLSAYGREIMMGRDVWSLTEVALYCANRPGEDRAW